MRCPCKETGHAYGIRVVARDQSRPFSGAGFFICLERYGDGRRKEHEELWLMNGTTAARTPLD